MKYHIQSIAAILLLIMASCTSAPQPESYRCQSLCRFQLPNGLKVNLLQDITSPNVSIKMAVDTSYRDENPGQEGVRLVAVSQVLGRTEMMEKVEGLGGWWDPTNYYSEVSSKDFVFHSLYLDQGLTIVADMLGAMHGSRDAEMAGEFEARRREELEELGDKTTPGVETPKPSKIDVEAFTETGRHQDPRGLMPDMRKLTAKDVLDFRRRVLKPSRCSLTIVGAFDAHALRQKIELKLASIRDDSPPEAPRILDTFLAGKHVRDKGDKNMLAVALAVPDSVETPMASMICRLLKNELDKIPEGPIQSEMRKRPGQRIMVFAMPGDPASRLDDLPQALQVVAEKLRDGVLEELKSSWIGSLQQNRLGNFYWQTWAAGFIFEDLYHADKTPWEMWQTIDGYHASDVIAALSRFNLRDSVTVEYRTDAPGREEVQPGSPRPHKTVVWKESKNSVPPLSPEDTADQHTLLNARTRTSPSGMVLTLEAPQFGGGLLRGTYPLGLLSPQVNILARHLESTKPSCIARFSHQDDRLEFQAMWNAKDPNESANIKAIVSWLLQTPTDIGDPLPVTHPQLHFTPEGDAPTWLISYIGHREGCEQVMKLPVIPGRTWATPIPGKLSKNTENADITSDRILIPSPPSTDASNRLKTILLFQWLNPESRQVGRYGPFTLVLPPLHGSVTAVGSISLGGKHWLSVKTTDLPATRDWLRAGASLDTLDATAYRKLQGHARSYLSMQCYGLQTLQAEALRRLHGAGPLWWDLALTGLDTLSREEFLDFARRHVVDIE